MINKTIFFKSKGIAPPKIEPYNFQKYKGINPRLTEEAYEICRRNGWEWKIISGKAIYNFWTLIVPPLKHLDYGNDINNRNNYYINFPKRQLTIIIH